MRFLKLAAYILAVIVLQTVIFPRLSFMGVYPDLILVSVIAFAVLAERNAATLFSGSLAFLQDVFSAGIYLNTIVKVIVSNAVCSLKEEFMGNEYSLTAGLVAALTPLIILTQAGILFFFFEKDLNWPYLVFSLAATTLYNLLMVPLLFPVVKRIASGD